MAELKPEDIRPGEPETRIQDVEQAQEMAKVGNKYREHEGVLRKIGVTESVLKYNRDQARKFEALTERATSMDDQALSIEIARIRDEIKEKTDQINKINSGLETRSRILRHEVAESEKVGAFLSDILKIRNK